VIESLFSPLIGMIKRRQRSRLRKIMRGYRALKCSDHLDRIAVVKQALTEHTLNLTNKDFSPVVMGCKAGSGEDVVRQYLLIRVGGVNLNCALLAALGTQHGRVVFCLPKEWRDILDLHGFKVARYRSAILWQLYVLLLLFYGVAQIGRAMLAGMMLGKIAHENTKNYAYFSDLSQGNLPKKLNGKGSHDVISWYLQWVGRVKNLDEIRHNVSNAPPAAVDGISVLPCQRLLPDLAGWSAIIKYGRWGLQAAFVAGADCLRGRWWHSFLLNQAALAAQVRILPTEALAREYLFHNSGWMYRPLWTYEAEKRGSLITFYFYSTNCEAFKRSGEYPSLGYGWKGMTWCRYLVWDQYQADFVRRAVGESANISVVGPIWFQGSADAMPKIEKPGVAVFDVTPHRQSRYCTLGIEFEYYIPTTSTQFLEHVANVTSQLDTVMLWKGKRKIGSIAHPHYRHFAGRLAQRENVELIDSDISAQRVIESSCAVISLPFTSTALIARELGKPSCYYDPTGMVQKDDRAAHGIPVVTGVDELEQWLSMHIDL